MENILDRTDKAILAALQDDADGPIAQIAERAGVSQTPCWKRIKKLHDKGIITKKVALVDPDMIGLALVGYVQIRTTQHTDAWAKKFATVVTKIPEIVECHRMSGEIDYLIKIVAPNMAGYDAVYKRLIKAIDLAEVSTSFSMERLKHTTALPLDYASA